MTGERDDHYNTARSLFGGVLKASRDAFSALQESLAPDTDEQIRLRVIEGFLVPWADSLPEVVTIDVIDGGTLFLNTRNGSLSIETDSGVDREPGERAWYDHAEQIVSRLVVVAIFGANGNTKTL